MARPGGLNQPGLRLSEAGRLPRNQVVINAFTIGAATVPP